MSYLERVFGKFETSKVFSPDMSLRVSIKVRMCPHLLIPRGLNLFKRIQQGYSVILMSYKQPNSKSEGCIKNSSVADRSDCRCSNARRFPNTDLLFALSGHAHLQALSFLTKTKKSFIYSVIGADSF